MSARKCPSCGAVLNRIAPGPDGAPLELTVDHVARRRVVERRRVEVFYSCPGCEHVETGSREVAS